MLFTAGVSLDWHLGLVSRVGLETNGYGGSQTVLLLLALVDIMDLAGLHGRLEELSFRETMFSSQ